MAVEFAGKCLHCSYPLLSPPNSLIHKTLSSVFSIQSTSNHMGHKSFFLPTDIIHRSYLTSTRRRTRVSSIASLNEDEFVNFEFLPSLLSIEQRSNPFDLPLSLRILKQKKKQSESTKITTDSTFSPVKRAFSSMVFIVRELQTHTIRMREALFSSNLHIPTILNKVHDELHASFVWLFQRIFSTTPTLMIYLMLLLVNFTAFSLTDYPSNPNPPTQSLSSLELKSESKSKSSSDGISAVVGGNSGGGGRTAQAVAGASGDFSSSFYNGCTISTEDDKVWEGIVEEAESIRANLRHEALMDPDTLRGFVSPFSVQVEPDDLSAYVATEEFYRREVAKGIDDSLILANFAQFLFVVLGDYDRAEEYFKRAALAKPRDPEAISRYANFLWVAKKDLMGAEETFLEAIEADPGNSYYSANYAHFLWSTGGEDTCYPLDAQDS